MQMMKQNQKVSDKIITITVMSIIGKNETYKLLDKIVFPKRRFEVKPSYSSLCILDCSICEGFQTFSCQAVSPVPKLGVRCHCLTIHTRVVPFLWTFRKGKGWSWSSEKLNLKVSQVPLSYYLNIHLITDRNLVWLLKVKFCLLICLQDIITPLVLRSINHYSGCS